jgi:mRNA interferase YafQ
VKGLRQTSRFRRDLKRELRADPNVETRLREVLALLLQGESLHQRHKDHPLAGEWSDHRDCHLRPDLVLIYKSDDTDITLVRLGSHSELFS